MASAPFSFPGSGNKFRMIGKIARFSAKVRLQTGR